MGGRLKEGPTDGALWITQRPVGADQGCSAWACRLLESGPSTFRPMGEGRSFRAYFQAVEQRSRQRIHDDRCHYCTRSSTQRWCAKKNGAQAIGRSRGGLTTKIHALV